MSDNSLPQKEESNWLIGTKIVISIASVVMLCLTTLVAWALAKNLPAVVLTILVALVFLAMFACAEKASEKIKIEIPTQGPKLAALLISWSSSAIGLTLGSGLISENPVNDFLTIVGLITAIFIVFVSLVILLDQQREKGLIAEEHGVWMIAVDFLILALLPALASGSLTLLFPTVLRLLDLQ